MQRQVHHALARCCHLTCEKLEQDGPHAPEICLGIISAVGMHKTTILVAMVTTAQGKMQAPKYEEPCIFVDAVDQRPAAYSTLAGRHRCSHKHN